MSYFQVVVDPNLSNYKVRPSRYSTANKFVRKYHYSHSLNGVRISYVFHIIDSNGIIVGAAVFGKLAMKGQWEKYVDKEEDIIELRRLACMDDTPKNLESYFVSRCLKWLRDNTKIKYVISYADPNYGHTGAIYKACNFTYLGQTSKSKVIVWNGKRFHEHSQRTKYNGKLKPFAKRLKVALENGEAKVEETLGKHIYLYDLRRRNK